MPTLNIDKTHLDEEDLQRLVKYTNLTHLSIGSKSRLIFDIVNNKLRQQALRFEENVEKPFLRNAEGLLLDYIGEIFGVNRPQAKGAVVSAEEQNIYFYTLETNFGSINNGNDIYIPKNTRIFNTIEDDENKVVYITIADTVLPADENKYFIGVKSESQGQSANIGENSLNFHDFTNYADAVNGTLFVSNSSSITYGSDELSDDNYRYLIKQQPLLNEAANFDAIETTIKYIPGVAGVKRILYSRGIGTADWVIKATTPTVPESLLTTIQKAIDEVKADGLDHRAISPVTIGLQLYFSIKYKERLEEKEKTKIKDTIRRNLLNYINALDIGQKLVIDQLSNTVLNSSDKIESMGTYEKKFDKIVVYKRSDITGSRLKKTLIADYETKEFERVIAEQTIDTPIIITDQN